LSKGWGKHHKKEQDARAKHDVLRNFWHLGNWLHGTSPNSARYSYILLAVDYVSVWVEAKATKSNDARQSHNF